MKWGRLAAVVVWSATFAIPAAAQEIAGRRRPPPVPADSFVVDVWTTEHGLPQNSINALAKTPDGYLWLGTSAGLVRFDGARFELMKRSDSANANLDRVRHLKLGRDGTLWIGTEVALLWYRDGEFTRVDLDGSPVQAVSTLTVAPDGTVWTSTGGGVFAIRHGRAARVDPRRAVHLAFDGRGLLWVTWPGSSGALPHRALAADRLDVAGAMGPERIFLGTDSGGTDWFGNPDYGSSARVRDGIAVRLRGATSVGRVLDVARDPHGTVWLATFGDGLLAVGDDDVPQPVYLPRASTVGTVLVDGQGVVWAGTAAGGLLRVRRSPFRVYSAQQGFAPRVAAGVMQRADGSMMFGSICGGVYTKPPGSGIVNRMQWSGPQMSCATSFAEDAVGQLWVGGWGALVMVRGGVGKVMHSPDGAAVRDAVSLHAMPDGSVWAGTAGNGVFIFGPDGTQRRLRSGAELPHDDVRFITRDRDGRIWIGTVGGVVVFDGATWVTYTTQHGLGANYVRSVHHAADGAHWLGTYGGGLARLRDGRLVAIRQRDGLAEDAISAILPDDAGNIWMSGNAGVFRARLAELDSFANGQLRRVHSVAYGRADGLLEPETNGGFHPAAWRARDGLLWFPTLEGVAVVNPAVAAVTERPPTPSVHEVRVNGAIRALQGQLALESGRPSLELHYTGLGVAAPEHLTFRYRLTPYEKEWTDAGHRRVAYFPRLPPGDYRFEVSAAGHAGLWSAPSELIVRVDASLWETSWVRIGLLSLLLVAIVLLVRRRFAALDRERQQQQALARALIQEQERERRRIAAALHDGMGQDLLLAGNYARLALTSDPGAAREYTERFGELTADALRSIRDLARTLAPRQLEHAGLRAALQGVMRTAAEASGVLITLECDDVDALLTEEARINVFRIVQEGLNNTVRHADASSAVIRVRLDPGPPASLEILVEDDGRGFDQAAARPHAGLGLGSIAERVTILGGTLRTVSSPGKGTRHEARIPVSHGLHAEPVHA
ncbi:MAG: two-component regulator propeller domain-containing protein [Gemmatimonadaceae bacterium]